MRRKSIVLIGSIVLVAVSGCAGVKQQARDVKDHVVDLPKAIWGNSTRALEEARTEAMSQSFPCAYENCFNAILALGEAWTDPAVVAERENTVLTGMPLPDPGQGVPTEAAASKEGEEEVVEAKKMPFTVFFYDRVKRHIIVIGVPGSVDSTEVGIFFDDTSNGVKVDIASLSSHAKRTVAATVFKGLASKFGTETK